MSQPVSGPNSAKPTTGATVAGVYNATPPVLEDGQACPIQVDINGQIKTSGGGGATSDVNIKDVNGSAPALTNPLPVELSDGTNAFGTAANPLSVELVGDMAIVSASNSTTTPLNAGQNFTGPAIDLLAVPGFTAIQVQLLTDQSGTLLIQFSTDNGSHWDHTIAGQVTANESASMATGIHGRYVRVKFINTSASNETYLRLQTLLVPTPVCPTVKDQDTPMDIDDNCMSVRASISGKIDINKSDYADVKVNPSGELHVSTSPSILGDTSIVTRRNQYDINFSSSDFSSAALLTNTATGGGSATQSTAMGIYSAGSSTLTAGDAKAVTVQTFVYRPGFDIYAYFTAAFVPPTDTDSTHNYIRIGMYGTTDGIYIGYEGNVFSASVRKNSVDTHVGQSSFNLDPLDGSNGSAFTRNGTPEAVNFADLNLYRIRWSWFGAAPIWYEIYTPDGVWIPFQIIKQPNTSTTPSVYSTALPMTGEAFKSASSTSTNVQFAAGCWACGSTATGIRISDSLTDSADAELVRAVIAGKNPSGTYSNVGISAESALNMSGSGAGHANAATWTTITGSQIAAVGGANNDSGTGVSTLTTTYSPTAGAARAAVVFISFNGAVTGLTVKDNLNNSLTAGPVQGNTASFYQFPIPSGVTSYVAAWTTARQVGMVVEEYSGVNAVDASLSGNTASGTSTTVSITAVPDEASDFLVCGLANASTNVLTGTVGNTRQTVPASAVRMLLMDTAGNTCTATMTSAAWTAVAIGLRPTIISGTALNTAVTMVNNSFAYNSVAVEIVPTGTILGGSVTGEVSIDNTNWIGINGVNTGTGAALTSPVVSLPTSTTGLLYNITGYNYFRMRLSAQVAGYLGQVVISYNVQGLASPNVSSTITNGNITVNDNQGTPNTLANAWPFQITDTSNGPAAVKAASTAAVAADASLVVGLSPNSPIAYRAATTVPAAVADGVIVPPQSDKYGHPVTVLNAPRDLIGTATLNDNHSTYQDFIGAGAAGVFNDIISLIITNESSTATIVSLADSDSSPNIYKFAIAANGGIVANLPTPLPQAVAAKKWQVLNSAAVALDYVAIYAKNK